MRNALGRLLFDCGIAGDLADSWFKDARFVRPILFVPDQASGQSIGKLFGPQLREVVPDLVIRVETFTEKPKQQPAYLNAKGRKWLAQQQKLSEQE